MAENCHYPESDYEVSASSKPINLQLMFTDEVASPVFTKKKIRGGKDGNESIKVILVDAKTQQNVTNGRVAFAKVKIVLIREIYDGTTTDNGEFEKNIVVHWQNKKNLLQGDVDVYLKHGIGTVGEIRIKQDKDHLRNVEFRLGAMVVDCPYEVKPAITQSFKVKDRRIEPKLRKSLSLTDKVWQLINIGKNGAIHKRLESSNVRTVKDFLHMYSSNRYKLQEIYKINGKKWEETVKHAKTCNMDNSPGQVGPTYSRSNSLPSIELDNNCYIPQPCEIDLYGENMIYDPNFSTEDLEACDMMVCIKESLPFEASRQQLVCDASTVVGHGGEGNSVKANKRWKKMRTLWFSIVSLKCGCAT